MADETIGGIAVDIVGNYAPLAADLDTAAGLAAKAGQEIAEGMNAGAAAVDQFSGAVTAASVGMGDFEARVATLVNSGSTLAEALAQVQAETEDAAAGLIATGSAAETAAHQLELFDEAISVPYADEAGQLNLFATELEPIAAAAQSAATGVDEFGKSAEQVAQETAAARAALQEFFESTEKVTEGEHHAAEGLSEWHEKLIAFAEALAVTEVLREFGQEALQASDNITRASISLTALTGSGEKAAVTIEEIEALGIKDGLSMPGLLTAATRMTALLPAGANVVELLGQIANGATVMGKDIGAAADSFDRLVTMGTLGARQLLPLGLTLDQVAKAMNEVTGASDATAANVGKMFKAMESTERVEVLSSALEHLSGIAQQAAEHTFGGQWTILANQWEQVMRQVGDALIPVITGLTNLMKVDVLPFLKSLAEQFNSLPAPVKELVVGLGLAVAAFVPLTLALGGIGLAFDAALAAAAPLVAIVGGPLLAVLGVGLLAALSAAVFGFHDLSAAMAENQRAMDAMDVKFQAHMAALVESAHTAAELALAEQKVKDALDAGAISKETATKLLGELAAAEKLVVGTEWNAWASAAGISIKLVTEALTPAQAAAEGLRVKMQTLGDAVTATRDKLVNTTAAFNDHKATAQDVAKAYDAWQGATNTLKSAQEALLPVVANIHHATKEWVDITAGEYPSAAKVAADATDALQIKIAAETKGLEEAQKWLDVVLQKYKEHNATAEQVAKALDGVTKSQDQLNKSIGQLPTSIIPPKWADDLKQAGILMNEFVPKVQALTPAGRDATSILHDMGIKTDDLGISVSKLIQDYRDLGAQDHTIEAESAAWDKVSGAVAKLAKTDLPAAMKLYDEHIAQLQKLGATQGQLLAWQAQYIQGEVKTAEQTGTSATAQIVALEKVRLQQQVLYDQTHLLGDVYVGVIKDILHGWEALGKSIADNIIDENNWHDVWINGIKAIAKSIAETLVGGAFKALEDSILKSTGLMDGLKASFDKLLGNAASGAAGNAASGAANAGGGASSITNNFTGGGALSAAGAIGSVVSAIEGAFGLAQMSHLISTDGKIEENTRRLDIVFEKFANTDEWDRHQGLLDKFDMIFNRLGDISSEIQFGGQSIVEALGGIPKMADGGAVIGDGLRYLHDGEVVIPRAEVPPLLAAGMLKGPGTNYGTAATMNSFSGLTFNIYEAANSRETARQLADTLKTLSGKFSAYGQ